MSAEENQFYKLILTVDFNNCVSKQEYYILDSNNELKLNKLDQQIYEPAIETILNNCSTNQISNTKIINSSQFKNSIAKYNLPLMTIN